VTGRVGDYDNPGFTSLQNVGPFSTGWTHITSVRDGWLLFYRASDGYAVTGRFGADGAFTSQRNVGPFALGWNQVVPALWVIGTGTTPPPQ